MNPAAAATIGTACTEAELVSRRSPHQVVAITGAARGIGYTIAEALLKRGVRVAISDIDAEELENAATRLRINTFDRLDVTNGVAFGQFLDRVEHELGPLDALINNAGIMPTGPLLEESDNLSRRILEVNTLGTIIGTRKALERMVPRRNGHIINMASTMGEIPVPGLATYNASKAGMIMFSDAARLEFRKSGVKISVILPGAVNTELATGIKGPRGIKNIEPEQVAEAVIGTLRRGKSRSRVYLPRSFGMVVRSRRYLPRPVSETVARALGAESAVLEQSDLAARAAYQQRVQRS